MRRKGPVHLVLLSAGALLLALGCGAGTQAPIRAVDAYAAALGRGDYDAAYALMSARYRREHPKADFVRLLSESPAEVKETRRRLITPRRGLDVRARVTYGDLRDELSLVREGGAWRIDGAPLSFYPQDTPEHALRSFLRAVDLRRWTIVLRFVPDAYAKTMTPTQIKDEFEGENAEENRAMRELLKGHLEAPVIREGDTARMPFGERFEVRFVREAGRWKIEDPY